MKRKSLLFALLMALFMPWVANAQETVEIGDGTSAGYYTPIGTYYNYSITEQLYTAEEIGMAGTIGSISFNYAGTAAKDFTITVYMMNVEAADLSTGISLADAEIVFDGTLSVTGAGWATITLDDAFAYDGASNLLIGIKKDAPNWYSGSTWYYTAAANMARYSNQDGTTPFTTSTVPGTVTNNRPNIQIVITPSTTGCDMPTAIAVSDITTDGATVTWEGEGNTWNLRYKVSTDADYTLVEGLTSQTYTFVGLADNTTYNVGVQADCGDATSTFKSTTFTTANACAAPTGLQITGITAESATLTWTPGYQETEWTVKYKKSSDSEYITETVNGTPTLTLSNLDGLTTYNVQVYNCENYVSGNFTTAAGIPLNEAFGTAIPTGWTMYTGLLSNVMSGTALTPATYGWNFGTGNNVFDNHARVNIYGNNQRWLVLPTLVMEDNVQLTFDMALTVYSSGSNASPTPGNQADDRFIVLITTDGGTTWEILREWNNTGSEYVYDEITNAATGQTVAIDLSSYAGQNIAVAFYGESTENGGDNNLHIDNVSIDYIPACAKPTGLAASDVTAHEATITWTSDATAWQVQLDDEDPIDVEEASYTFENLDPETTYTAKVRANCSGTYSEWTTAVSFTTTIACPAPTNLTVTPNALTATFTWESNAGEWEVAYATDATAEPEEFIVGTVNEATYTVNDLELGDYYFWVRANCGDVDGYSQWAGPASVHIGYCVPNPSTRDGKGITKVIFGTGDYLVNNVDETNGLPAASPFYGDYSSMVGAMQAGVESTISITYATGSGTVYSYGTIIWVDWDNSLSFEDSEIVYTGTSVQGSGGVPQVLEASFIVPVDQATGEYRMRIAGADSYFDSYISGTATANHSACFSASYAVCHDYTLRVLEAPSCLTPTDLAVNYTGGTEATISWTSDAEAWNMRVNGVDVEGTIANPYTLTGLELATTYSVEVQANCGEGGTSEWSNPVSFTTDLCLPEDQCEISYSFTDQYNDSWNNAYMNIVDATTQEVLYELTMPNVTGPYEGSFNVCDGRDIQFVWVSGNYPRECGYIFTHNGETILEKATNTTAPTAGVVLTYTVDCGGASYTLTIDGYEDDTNEGGYYLIASPLADNVDPATVGMITDDLGANATPVTSTYDLYYFDQEEDDEWRNYRDETFEIVPGKGYLYASKEGTTITFTGVPGTNGQVTLSKTNNTNADFQGWNLIGNPFAETAYITGDYEFYTLNSNGTELEASTSNSIEAMEGVFVIATNDGETLTFTTEEPNNDKSMLALNLSKNDRVIDRAIVRFCESRQLPKFQLRKNSTKIYIPMEDNDYAVVRSEGMGEMPVSFKAEENGNYTIGFNTENVEFGYLHLIDNMTGADVDLLSTPSYSFEARTTDYASRFKLVFATGNADDSFAFFSNGNFVINNEGMATVQVIDINGRIMSSETINGCANVNVNAAAGVYMIRLINGENVKVQKVVVK